MKKKFVLADYTSVIKDWSEYEELTPKQAILANCYDCCAYQSTEVKLCQSKECPLWLFKEKWWRTPRQINITEEQRQAFAERMKAMKRSENG